MLFIPGYTVHLTVIDASPDAAERIEAACPELVIGPHRDVPGDMRYRIEVLQRTTGTLSFETFRALRIMPPAVWDEVLKLNSAIGRHWSDVILGEEAKIHK